MVPPPSPNAAPSEGGSRWSADAWLALRSSGGSAPLLAGQGTYGASQAGLVLRYRLAAAVPIRPSLYLRAASAMGSVADRELALGIAIRPAAALPVAILAEGRATRGTERGMTRIGVMAVSEVSPFALPLGVTGEAYGQAGLVTGPSGSAFAEGQIRASRCLTCPEDPQLVPAAAPPAMPALRAGLGLWAGAQRGAARLDGGPGLTLVLRTGSDTAVRLDADWHFRLAGHARPGSGPALTLSAGFWGARP